MKDNLSRYTLRVDQALLDKLGYIAEYEGRTKNRELEQMIKKRIRDFEQEHGEPLAEFEQRVNEWAKTVDVVSVTTVAQTYGCEVDIRTVLAITVHYN